MEHLLIRFRCFIIIAGLVSITGCSSWLPRSDTDTRAPWKDFEQAKNTYDKIVPNKTTQDELHALGLDPFHNSNIQILSYLDLIKLFNLDSIIDESFIDEGLRDCVAEKTICSAYKVEAKFIHKERTGNFWLDLLNFKRVTDTSGWGFIMVVVINKELVVHKLWSGQPAIEEHEKAINPLGPVQGVRDFFLPSR
jgi:hypothetical protein